MKAFRLPDIGEGLSEAELLEWVVAVGDEVSEGDEVASVSTDKVNVELSAPWSGTVKELCWQPGDIIQVGEVLMRFTVSAGADREKDAAEAISDRPSGGAGGGNQMNSRPGASQEKVRAAPAVRKYAKDSGVDLRSVTASGPDHRILKDDIDDFLAARDEQSEDAATESSDLIELKGARLSAATNLARSTRTLVTTTLTFESQADAILKTLEESRPLAEKRGAKLTPLAVIAKCVARALELDQRFNAVLVEDASALRISEQVHLGIAVDTPHGLVVPVVRDVNNMNVFDLADAISKVAAKAKAGSLDTTDVGGSTFTLSSTGGLERATMVAAAPIINFPNVATLWISRIVERPRVIDGKLEAGPMMACSLSFDHRFLQGADGIAFINSLDEIFTNPAEAI